MSTKIITPPPTQEKSGATTAQRHKRPTHHGESSNTDLRDPESRPNVHSGCSASVQHTFGLLSAQISSPLSPFPSLVRNVLSRCKVQLKSSVGEYSDRSSNLHNASSVHNGEEHASIAERAWKDTEERAGGCLTGKHDRR